VVFSEKKKPVKDEFLHFQPARGVVRDGSLPTQQTNHSAKKRSDI